MFIDLVQINLIEAEVAGRGRIVSVAAGGEIEMVFARHDDMNVAMDVRNGKAVRRIEGCLRGDERPDTDARVWRSRLRNGKLRGGEQCEEQ